MLATQVSYWTNVENERSHRANEALKSRELDIMKMNADINEENAATNRYNAGINYMNAETNRLNYGVNSANAATNARNAATNAKNAATNAFNASVNAAAALGTTNVDEWVAQGHQGTVGSTESNATTNWMNYQLDNSKFTLIDLPRTQKQIEQIGKEMNLTDAQIARVQAETEKLSQEARFVGPRAVSGMITDYMNSVANIVGSVQKAFNIGAVVK